MGEIVEMCVSRALGSSLPNTERRAQTIDRTTAVNLCLYIPTNRSIDEEEHASHPNPRRRRRLCRVKNDVLPNGHGEGGVWSSIWRDAPSPLCELAIEGLLSGCITIIGASSSSSMRQLRRGTHLCLQLPNRLFSTRQEQNRYTIMKLPMKPKEPKK